MVVLTAIAINLDAYIVGVSLGLNKFIKLRHLLYISSFAFILPIVALLFLSTIPANTEVLNIASACILILLGIKSMLSELSENRRGLLSAQNKKSILELTLLGIPLSIDTLFATALFADMNGAFVLPLLIFSINFTLLSLGNMTAKLLNVTCLFSKVAGVILVIVGLFRLI